MQARMFERWCEGLQVLSAVQVGRLRERLEQLDDRLRGLAMIEDRAGDARECRHCGGTCLRRWGRTGCGVQRWRCRDCLSTMSSTTATPMARVRRRDRFLLVLEDMLGTHPSSCRQLAARLGIDKMTAWRWRQVIMASLAVDPANGEGVGHPGVEQMDRRRTLAGIVEADETFCRESRKASREWVRHRRDPQAHPRPDRPRWKDFRPRRLRLPTGTSRYRIPILTVADRAGRVGAERLATRRGGDLLEALDRQLTPDVVLCSDGDPVYRLFAEKHGLPHQAIHSNSRQRVIDRVFHIQTVNNMHQRFKTFIRPFRGPATRYLDGYIQWFLARVQPNENPLENVFACMCRVKTT